MPSLNYRPIDYQTMVRFSKHKHILVEGRNDKRVFDTIIDEIGISDLVVDSAESLVSQDGNECGNREKVEYICRKQIPNLVGFVDREFREFEISDSIVDNINEHKVNGRVVWSRGHSIENYCIERHIVRSALRVNSLTSYFRDAVALFDAIYDSLLQEISAVSLAGYEVGMLTVLRKSIDPRIFRIETSREQLEIDTDYWRRILSQKSIRSQKIEAFIEKYQQWRSKTQKIDLDTLRWVSHGHVGMAFIWSAYSSCVYHVARKAGENNKQARKEAQRVLKAEETIRMNYMCEYWIKSGLKKEAEFPFKVLHMINVTI